MPRRPLLSVVVPAYNEARNIERCLARFEGQTVPRGDFEVVVSDSSSTDETRALARKLADKVVKCKLVSAGYGRNAGVKKARSQNLAFVDADTLVSDTWVEGALDVLSKGVAGTGSVRTYDAPNPFVDLYYRIWSFQTHASTLVGFPLLPGFNFAVKKDAFEEAGGFFNDSRTCEDLAFSRNVKHLGPVRYSRKMRASTSCRRPVEMGLFKYWWTGVEAVFFDKVNTWENHKRDW